MKIKNLSIAISFLQYLVSVLDVLFLQPLLHQKKKAAISTTELATSAKAAFWEILHGGAY